MDIKQIVTTILVFTGLLINIPCEAQEISRDSIVKYLLIKPASSAVEDKNEPIGKAEQEDKIYDSSKVDVPAEFPGGISEFQNQIVSLVGAIPVEEGVKALQVILYFVIEKDGTIGKTVVMRDPGYGAGPMVVRVLKVLPKWTPAQKDDKIVRTENTIVIKLKVRKETRRERRKYDVL